MKWPNTMSRNLIQIKAEIYDKCGLKISNLRMDKESEEYDGCHFILNDWNVVCRSAKITPKKVGQFVTFWKRNQNGVIEPFNESDHIDFYIVNVKTKTAFGQFVFPKSLLVKQGIMSTKMKEGKRGFRVYPNWDVVKNRQAQRTQKWQLDYFYQIGNMTDLNSVNKLYHENGA